MPCDWDKLGLSANKRGGGGSNFISICYLFAQLLAMLVEHASQRSEVLFFVSVVVDYSIEKWVTN